MHGSFLAKKRASTGHCKRPVWDGPAGHRRLQAKEAAPSGLAKAAEAATSSVRLSRAALAAGHSKCSSTMLYTHTHL